MVFIREEWITGRTSGFEGPTECRLKVDRVVVIVLHLVQKARSKIGGVDVLNGSANLGQKLVDVGIHTTVSREARDIWRDVFAGKASERVHVPAWPASQPRSLGAEMLAASRTASTYPKGNGFIAKWP